MLAYPVKLKEDDNGTFLVTSPDFPELTTFGETEEEAIRHAVGAFEEAIAARIADREDIPEPGRRGRAWVSLPLKTELTVALYRAMRQKGIRKTALAKRLSWHLPQVDRLLDPGHQSRLDQMEAAFSAIGFDVKIDIAPARRKARARRRKVGLPGPPGAAKRTSRARGRTAKPARKKAVV
ncbi:MAG: type II toxin-antitoxin system HicB family antitoxin [Nitrospinota bacterium]